MDSNAKLNMNVMNAPMSGIRKISDMVMQMKDVVRMDLGEPDFDVPEHIKEAAIKAIRDGFSHYTAGPGIMDLRKAAAAKFKAENGLDFDPETEITVTQGGIGAIFSALQTVVNPGDEVIVTDPVWPAYLGVLAILEAKPVVVTLKEKNGFNMMPEDVKAAITGKTKVIVVNSPNNPTGGVMTDENMKGIAKIASEKGIFVLSDESYEKLMLGKRKHLSIGSLPGMRDLTMTQFTLSKTYAMTGWRIGFAVANKELSSGIRKVSLYTITHANSVAQKAAVAALTGPQDCVEKMVAAYRERAKILTDGLNATGKISCLQPEGAFYAFANISKINMNSEDFVLKMIKEAKVSAVNGSSFGESGEGFVRFCFANSTENIKEAVKRISGFVKTL
ncbi:MAG: pyridoxal phosphate-dependent aminotransferase [Candidatus Firestonebacteria bacterium]|nr:pyridoxal phosphate-dependent aminotransferase [Candidatus Firestonebacteria bacterium]